MRQFLSTNKSSSNILVNISSSCNHPQHIIINVSFSTTYHHQHTIVAIMSSLAVQNLTSSDVFIFSPFGLGCWLCSNNSTIQLDARCISRHLEKHDMDNSLGIVCCLLQGYRTQLADAKLFLGVIEPYRCDSLRQRGCFYIKFPKV